MKLTDDQTSALMRLATWRKCENHGVRGFVSAKMVAVHIDVLWALKRKGLVAVADIRFEKTSWVWRIRPKGVRVLKRWKRTQAKEANNGT